MVSERLSSNASGSEFQTADINFQPLATYLRWHFTVWLLLLMPGSNLIRGQTRHVPSIFTVSVRRTT